MTDLKNRIAVVTGASRGIGRAIALELARRGAHVVAAARTVGALEELDDEIKAGGGAATLVPVDMKDMEALDRLGAAINERWGRLDIFVGNAGLLGSLSPLGHFTPKQWDEVMAVNVTANWRLIRSLDPLLRQSDAGRVVMISSGIVKFCHAYWGLYAASKAALEAMTRCYAAETAESTQVRAIVVRPGPLRTRMRAAAMPGEDPMKLKTPEDIAPKIADLCAPSSTATNAIYDFPTDSIRGFD